jgi:hypothetical protein
VIFLNLSLVEDLVLKVVEEKEELNLKVKT